MPTAQQITSAIDTHFALRQECLFQTQHSFPYQTTDIDEQARLKVLSGAGLVTATIPHAGLMLFSLTSVGTAATTRFCYGHRSVKAVENISPIKKQGSVEIVQAQYRYGVDALPSWAESADLQAAFPELRAATHGAAEDHATIGWTGKQWRIPN